MARARGAAGTSRHLLSTLKGALRQHAPLSERVLVAVSGGQDSVALAVALHELYARGSLRSALTLAHCNHGWAGDCAGAAHVCALAVRLRTPLLIARGTDVSATEAGAREWRYAALRTLADAAGARDVLVAHTRTDRAETALINLAAGAGAGGVGAMRAVRAMGDGFRVLRPLLGVTREQTEIYCRERGVPVWKDPYNKKMCFARARVREIVMPVLRDRLNPRVEEAFARAAVTLRDDADALDEIAGDLFNKAVRVRDGAVVVRRALLLGIHVAIQRRVLRRVLKLVARPGAHPCSFAHVEALCVLLTKDVGNRAPSLQGGAVAYVDDEDCIVLSGGYIGQLPCVLDDAFIAIEDKNYEPIVLAEGESG